jgi:hypothetical protein
MFDTHDLHPRLGTDEASLATLHRLQPTVTAQSTDLVDSWNCRYILRHSAGTIATIVTMPVVSLSLIQNGSCLDTPPPIIAEALS